MELLHNRFEIIKRLSDTTVFEVYLAKDTETEMNVTVCKVREAFMQDISFVNGMTQGVVDCRDLKHPNTLKFIDVDADIENENLYYIYEYADGVSLKEVFEKQSKLSIQKSVEIAINVLQSLDNAHLMGICHGDLYSDDILITQDGQVKVRGYGRKDGIEASTIAKEHLSLETIKYQSPEVLETEGLYEASDVYSVGVILYQMLTGRFPFDGNTSVEIATKILRDAPLSPRMINKEISASLSSLILESINKQYNSRVGTASIFISRLTDVLRGYKQGEFAVPHENVVLKYEPEEKKRPMGPMLLVLFLVACVLTVAITVVSVNNSKMQMPNLVGLSEEDAVNKLQGLKLSFNKAEDKFSNEFGAGIVCDQSPKAGDRIGKKERIDYFVSKGVEQIKMPYVIGLNFEEAKEKLSMGNFKIELREENSNSVPDGTVLGTIPESGVTLDNGAMVLVTVSKGSGSYNSRKTDNSLNYGESENNSSSYKDTISSSDEEYSDTPRKTKKKTDNSLKVEKRIKEKTAENSKVSDTKKEKETSKAENKTESKKENKSERKSGYSSSGGNDSQSGGSKPDATVSFE